MRLHVVDVVRLHSRVAQHRLDHLLLRLAVGDGEARARAVLVERRAADDPPDAVAVSLRLVEALEDEDAAAFAAHVAVGGFVERLALAVGGKHARFGAERHQAAGEDDVDASRQRHVGLAALETRDGLVDGDEGGRARGVEGDGRALEAERERHAPDGGVVGGAGDGVEARRRVGVVARVQQQRAVLVVADARVDAGAAALQPLRIDARVLQRAPAGLQHQALLRVEQLRLHGGDAEEGRVEQVHLVQVRPEAARLAQSFGIGEEEANAPDAGAGDALADGVVAGLEAAPEGVKVVGAGESAGHADDGD